jgi:hypothetical protein
MFKNERDSFGFEDRSSTRFDHLPIKYTVPFEWGRLRVTESANEAYGLVPLTPSFIKGDTEISPSIEMGSLPPTNVLLVGPSEVSKENLPSDAFNARAELRLTKQGIDVILGFANDKETMAKQGEMILSQVVQMTDIDEDNLSKILNEDGISLSEAFEHSVPQQFAHVIPAIVKNRVEVASADWMRASSDTRLIKSATRSGIASLGIAALMLSPEIETGEPISALRASVAGGLLIGTFAGARSSIKSRLRMRRENEQYVNFLADFHSTRVAEAIHLTYCTNHFDRENEKRFED